MSVIISLRDWRKTALEGYVLSASELFAMDALCPAMRSNTSARAVFETWLRKNEESSLASGEVPMRQLYVSYHHGRLLRIFLGSLSKLASHVAVAGGYAAAMYAHINADVGAPQWKADDIDVFVVDVSVATIGDPSPVVHDILDLYSHIFSDFDVLPDDMTRSSYVTDLEDTQPDALRLLRWPQRVPEEHLANLRNMLARLPRWYARFAQGRYGVGSAALKLCARLWRWRLRNPRSKRAWAAVSQRVNAQLATSQRHVPIIARAAMYEIVATHTRALAVNLVSSTSPAKINVIQITPKTFLPWATPNEFARLVVSGFDLVPCCAYITYNKNEERFTFGGVYQALSAIRTGSLAFTPCAFQGNRNPVDGCIRLMMYLEKGFVFTHRAPWNYDVDDAGILMHETWDPMRYEIHRPPSRLVTG